MSYVTPRTSASRVRRRTPYPVASRRGPARSRRRQIPPRARGYLRVGGFYGRYSNGGELKFHDVDLDTGTIVTAGAVTPTVNIIPQGVLENNRVGRKCTIKSIMWRYDVVLTPVTASVDTTDMVRIIMFLDKQCNGATAAVLDILETADYQSFNNLSNTGRFRILMDKTHVLQAMSGSGRGTTDTLAFGENIKSGTFFKKCDIPIEYDNSASTGVLTTIRTNNIGVLLISKSARCIFESKIRMRFSDT